MRGPPHRPGPQGNHQVAHKPLAVARQPVHHLVLDAYENGRHEDQTCAMTHAPPDARKEGLIRWDRGRKGCQGGKVVGAWKGCGGGVGRGE